MKREFSFYEFTGVLLPGVTLLLGVYWLVPESRVFVLNSEITTGAFGLFVLIAYLSGHLLNAFGNFIELIGWGASGKPTHWITHEKSRFLGADGGKELILAIEEITGRKIEDRTKLSRTETNSIRGQLYARLQLESRTRRIDVFNGNYGMFRGISSAFLAIAIYGLVSHGWKICAPEFYIPLLGAIVAGYRCYRFGIHYASEIFWQTLDSAQSRQQPSARKGADPEE